MNFTLSQIAKEIQAEISGDSSILITGFSTADAAKPGDLVFAESETFFAAAEQSQASAVLVSGPFKSTKKPLLLVANTRVAVARLLPLFFPRDDYAPGIHPTAVIEQTAQIDSTAHIGPNVVIGKRSRVGARRNHCFWSRTRVWRWPGCCRFFSRATTMRLAFIQPR